MKEYEELMDGKEENIGNVQKYFRIAFSEAKKVSKFAEAYDKANDDAM